RQVHLRMRRSGKARRAAKIAAADRDFIQLVLQAVEAEAAIRVRSRGAAVAQVYQDSAQSQIRIAVVAVDVHIAEHMATNRCVALAERAEQWHRRERPRDANSEAGGAPVAGRGGIEEQDV